MTGLADLPLMLKRVVVGGLLAVFAVAGWRGLEATRRGPSRVLARLDAPVRVVVTAHETGREPCTQTGVAKVKCLFEPPPTYGCTTVDLGDVPAPKEPCATRWSAHHVVHAELPLDKASIDLDPTGALVAVTTTTTRFYAHSAGVVIAEVVAQRVSAPLNSASQGPVAQVAGLLMRSAPSGPPDWAGLEPLRAQPLGRLGVDDAEQREALKGWVRSLPAERQVALLDDESPDSEAWAFVEDAAEPPVKALLESTIPKRAAAGDVSVLLWLVAHHERQSPTFTRDLTSALETPVLWDEQPDVGGALLRELARRAPPIAASIACASLGRAVSQPLQSLDEEPLYFTHPSPSTRSVWFAAIAKGRLRCPWVTAAVEVSPCDEAAREEPERARCTAADEARGVAEWLNAEGDDALPFTMPCALSAALRAQGALPPRLEQKLRRSSYVVEQAGLASCGLDERGVRYMACAMPAEVRRVDGVGASCTLTADDQAGRLVVSRRGSDGE